MATARPEKEVEQQKGLVSVAEKPDNNDLSNVTSLRGLVVAARTSEAELLCRASAASSQLARAAVELRRLRDSILT